MINNSNTTRIAPARTAPAGWSPYAWMAVASGGAAIGLWLSVTSTPLPGAEPMTVEDPVDMVCLLLFGFLGAELLRRGIAEGLGRALMLMAGLQGANYLLAGIGDAVTDGHGQAPVVARLCSLGAEVLFIGTFFLLLYAPLALFPTGRLPGPRWRWLTWAAVLGFLAMAVSVVFAPGPVDEDNPATGANPLGLEDLGGLTSTLESLAPSSWRSPWSAGSRPSSCAGFVTAGQGGVSWPGSPPASSRWRSAWSPTSAGLSWSRWQRRSRSSGRSWSAWAGRCSDLWDARPSPRSRTPENERSIITPGRTRKSRPHRSTLDVTRAPTQEDPAGMHHHRPHQTR